MQQLTTEQIKQKIQEGEKLAKKHESLRNELPQDNKRDPHHFEINYRKYQRKAQWSAILFWIIAGLSTVAIIVLIKNLLQ